MYPSKPFIDSYYQQVKQNVREEIRSQPDAYLVSVDTTEYSTYLVAKYGFSEIVLDEDRGMLIEKERRMVDREMYDEIRKVEHLVVKVSLGVEPNATIPRILELSPSTFSMREPKMEYWDGWIVTRVSANQADVQRAVHDLKDEVARRNSDIRSQNDQLRTNINLWIAERRKQIENEDMLLEQISQKISVPLKRKVDPSTVIPPVLSVKEKVLPIYRPVAKAPKKLELPPETFSAILGLIDNSGRFFERTPSTFAKMEEEELRNVILSNLNSVYEGEAVGEGFSKKGKTDIYLKVEEGGIFIAECKYWDGAKTIDDSVKQILGYLTWRDSYGVVVVFSKRIGFTKVIDAASERILQLSSYVKAFKKITDTHFAASFSLPDDELKLIEMHFVIYYATRQESKMMSLARASIARIERYPTSSKYAVR
jgi:hypothetical protein